MVNIIWLLLLIGGIAVGFLRGNLDAVSNAVFSSAAQGIKITLEIAGVMAVWMGLLKLAEKSGLVDLIALMARPLISRLFPELPKGHAAMGSIIMNVAANLLGLGNAATPFGLKAMEQMQKLNSDEDKASASMITFLVINTSSFTLIPALVISLRVQAGSVFPEEIISATILASACGLAFAIGLDYLFRRFYKKRGL